MFDEYPDSDLFLVTTNSFVRNDGSLASIRTPTFPG